MLDVLGDAIGDIGDDLDGDTTTRGSSSAAPSPANPFDHRSHSPPFRSEREGPRREGAGEGEVGDATDRLIAEIRLGLVLALRLCWVAQFGGYIFSRLGGEGLNPAAGCEGMNLAAAVERHPEPGTP